MSYTLQQSINWAQTFIQYSPITAGLGQEPAVSVASMIRSTMLGPPQTWDFNRAEYTFQTVKGQQDYTVLFTAIPDFGYLEKATLTDSTGKVWEIKDVYNSDPLGVASDQQRPDAIGFQKTSSTAYTVRFVGAPNAVYTATLIYQKKPQAFGPFFISACGTAAAGNTTYTGVFDPLSFPAGATAQITGFVTHTGNNGSFVVVSCTATSLVLVNGAGVAETISAYANNFDWAPIPDWFIDIYNNLFLSEMLTVVDDAKSQMYRQRGVAAFLTKSQGLTDTQKNAFIQQWLARDTERMVGAMTTQISTQAKAI